MSQYVTTLFFLLLINLIIVESDDIWYSPGDQIDSSWVGIAYSLSASCPGITPNCWDLNALGSIERTVATTGYTNVQFQYFMSTGNENLKGAKACDIHYSTNGVDYTLISTLSDSNMQDNQLNYNTWDSTVDNISELTIRLTNTNGGYSCYFKDLKLFGITAISTTNTNNSTATPTTATPTANTNNSTATPTTATPTANTNNSTA
eukprot:547129_1